MTPQVITAYDALSERIIDLAEDDFTLELQAKADGWYAIALDGEGNQYAEVGPFLTEHGARVECAMSVIETCVHEYGGLSGC